MSRKLDGKVIIITGGSTGIGRATALHCAAEGAHLVIADVNEAEGQACADEAAHAGNRACFVKTDVARTDQVKALVAATIAEFGRLDAAFNNAGIEGDFTSTVKMSEESFDRTIAINLKGVWLCMKYELEQMLAQGTGGTIVNTASVAGLVGTRGGTAYCAAKHGVVGMTKSAALEYARKQIRVNAVCPGVIQTPMLDRLVHDSGLGTAALVAQEPMERLGQPREIGDAVVWLLSEESSFVTGIALPVDGGYTAL